MNPGGKVWFLSGELNYTPDLAIYKIVVASPKTSAIKICENYFYILLCNVISIFFGGRGGQEAYVEHTSPEKA